jgi:hypothetical protein
MAEDNEPEFLPGTAGVSELNTKDTVSQINAAADNIRYNLIPDRRQQMKQREIKLRKIVIALEENGYSKDQVNDILENKMSPELADSLVNDYNSKHTSDPDVSYLC